MKILSLFWHSVESEGINSEYFDGSNPTQYVFREQIEFIIEKFTPISIYDFINISENNYLMESFTKPPVLLGFDDGFKHVLDYALPILQEFHVPAIFFIIGQILVNPEYVPWYVEIEHMLRKTEKSEATYNSLKFDLTSKQDRVSLKYHLTATYRKYKSEKDRQRFANDLSHLLEVERPKASILDNDLCLVSKDDLSNLNHDSLLTVSSHAMTHKLLANLTHKEQIYELEMSHILLHEHCPSYYPVISYPNNSFNNVTIDIAKNIYKCAFAVFQGSSYNNIYAYPRIGIGNNNAKELDYIISPFRLNYVYPIKRLFRYIGIKTT